MMAGRAGESPASNSQVLQELDDLTHSLYQEHKSRRTASLALPRNAVPAAVGTAEGVNAAELSRRSESRPRQRRLSMSPWRSRPKNQNEEDEDDHNDTDHDHHRRGHAPSKKTGAAMGDSAASGEKKGIWNWKPMRALSHIGMHRLGCLFSIEVLAVERLPASMNGLRLSVAVRKKETRDGAVQSMPSRVLQGTADFEETLFMRCHVYCTGGAGTGKPLKFEPRPFLISAIAVDAPELDFGRSAVDLSLLVKESMEKNHEGERVRQWDAAFPLTGKAKGGELLLKLGFQIIEDGGVGIYSKAEASRSIQSKESSNYARKQSKSSFSVPSPRVARSEPSATPTREFSSADLKVIDEFNLDQQPEEQDKAEQKDDVELIDDFDVVDRGVEVEEKEVKGGGVAESGEVGNNDASSAADEMVKEVVHDSAHLARLNELEAIAAQINALESMMVVGIDINKTKEQDSDYVNAEKLDAEEETVRREFLQMLELDDEDHKAKLKAEEKPKSEAKLAKCDGETNIYLSDLGKGLGPVVQTRDGGYLAAINPFDTPVDRKEAPKLAMQLSRPFLLPQWNATNGFELFQRLAANRADELSEKLSAMAAMDELMGKTAEQIAFEGMASAIISGRNKELGASSSAAESVANLRMMAAALAEGRHERVATGIWNAREEPVVMEEVLAFSMQKIESMAMEVLKVQADMSDEQAPFEVSALFGKSGEKDPLELTLPPEQWNITAESSTVTLLVVLQLRDPLRRYEKVGAPTLVIIQATEAGGERRGDERFIITSLHVGGLRLTKAGTGGVRRMAWDGERQRLTALQWLVAYGFGKVAGRRNKGTTPGKSGQDMMWSMSSRVMAGLWLKPLRNPDVKLL